MGYVAIYIEALKPLVRAADKAEAELVERWERDPEGYLARHAHACWGSKYRHAIKARQVLKGMGADWNV